MAFMFSASTNSIKLFGAIRFSLPKSANFPNFQAAKFSGAAKNARRPAAHQYVGETLQEKRHGQGKMIFGNGQVWEGEFRDNMFCNGRGVIVATNKTVYEGVWVNGKLNGRCKRQNADGTVLKGVFKDGNIVNGTGVQHVSGTIFEGTWKAGKMEGKGKIIQKGSVYIGEIKDDRKHGRGIMTSPDGSKYEGGWVNGKKEGQGKATQSDGSTYVGEFARGHFHGYGVFTAADGSVYEGLWVKGKKHGQGKLTSANNETVEGEWENDVLVSHR